jgi:preprotein translocase subunit SecG
MLRGLVILLLFTATAAAQQRYTPPCPVTEITRAATPGRCGHTFEFGSHGGRTIYPPDCWRINYTCQAGTKGSEQVTYHPDISYVKLVTPEYLFMSGNQLDAPCHAIKHVSKSWHLFGHTYEVACADGRVFSGSFHNDVSISNLQARATSKPPATGFENFLATVYALAAIAVFCLLIFLGFKYLETQETTNKHRNRIRDLKDEIKKRRDA